MTKGDEVACFTIQQRGYLVVGVVPEGPQPTIGDFLGTWAGMDLSQPIVIVDKTTKDDWLEQCKLLIPRFRLDKAVPRERTGREGTFFKAITD